MSESDSRVRNSNLPPNSATTNLKIESEQSEAIALTNTNANSESTRPEDKITDLKLPISGAKVLKHFMKRSGMTEYEKSELLDFRQCYFLGLEAEKIKGSKFL